MNLISDRTHAIKQFVSKSTDQMLSRVHPHVSVARVPVDDAPNFVTRLQLMVCSNGVGDVVSPPHFRDL